MTVADAALETRREAAAASVKPAIAFLSFAGVTCALAPLAYVRMFSGFQPYDDEGIFLVALRDYLAGHPLMTSFVPLYGPFYFEVYGGLFKLLGIAPTHDSGRWLTLIVWLLASVAGGLIVLRLSRSVLLALAAQLLTFVVLGALAIEPTSTYGLSTLLLVALTGTATFRSARPRVTAVVIGGIVMALFLIKVNLGLFAAAATGLAWAASFDAFGRRLVLPVVGTLVSVLPVLVMWSLIRQTWVLEFAIVASCSVAAIAVTAVTSTRPAMPSPATGWLGAGAAAVAAVCIGTALAGGSRPTDIVNFLFVFPLRFPTVFTFPLNANVAVVGWAIFMLATAVAVTRIGEIPAPFRIGAGIFSWLTILLAPASVFLLALPLSWLAVRAPAGRGARSPDSYARLMVASLATIEALQAYPVAGTQTYLAAVGLVPVGAIVLNDGIRQLRASARWMLGAPAVLNVTAAALSGFVAFTNFNASMPLDLPGAYSTRVVPQQGETLRELIGSLAANHCSYLVTYPGMDSFYVWTDQQSSIEMRYGQWYLLLTPGEQTALVQQFQHQPGLCVIENSKLIDFWTKGRPPPSGQLVDFIDSRFVPAGTYGDYELLVRASS